MSEMTSLCASKEVAEGRSRGYKLTRESTDLSLLLVRKGGQIYAYRNRCPHISIPLEWVEHEFLTHDGSLIQCANHGALFVIETGQCVSGPCPGQSLERLPVIESGGMIYLQS
ncbi:Rieske (2Fe-2S) protein [Gilvimarinus chinensis]|uniref:Rieske (2Fe-2S) protein n=1 Tax=Gilvimarinus chinensis TaxID=396005 RepID=UPI000360FC5E|nr:Rieske (2Fe-2S) protein [Gilvimarinus chinensis]